MPSRHRRRLPRPLLFLASLLPVAAAGCVQDGPYGSYDPYYAERARAWQQEEAARRAGSAARYSDFEAERQARWREEMERRRAWAAQQRAWERARRAELGGGYGAQGGEVRREDLPPGTAPPYPQAHGYAPPQPSPYAAPAAPYGYPGAAPYPPAAYGALPPPQQGWY